MTINKRYDGVKKSKTFLNILKRFNLGHSRVLDIGCGQGEYLAHFGPRSMGINSSLAEVSYGQDNNLIMVGGNAEKLEDAIDKNEKFDYIWANNLFEHLLSPHSFLISLRRFSSDKTLLILGVPVIPRIPLLIYFRKFRGSLASNHINFFNSLTLALTIEKAGWIIEEERPFFSKFKFIDLFYKYFAPHLYLVCRKDVNFSYPPKKISEWEDQEYYQDIIKSAKN